MCQIFQILKVYCSHLLICSHEPLRDTKQRLTCRKEPLPMFCTATNRFFPLLSCFNHASCCLAPFLLCSSKLLVSWSVVSFPSTVARVFSPVLSYVVVLSPFCS